MALTNDYEPVRSFLLDQTPLLGLEEALPRLKSEVTHLGLTHLRSKKAFSVTDKRGKVYRNYNRLGHILPDCSSDECSKCNQKGSSDGIDHQDWITSLTSSTFDLIHSDVWGPAPTPSMRGARAPCLNSLVLIHLKKREEPSVNIVTFFIPVRAMLLSTLCPERAWGEYVLTAVHVLYRVHPELPPLAPPPIDTSNISHPSPEPLPASSLVPDESQPDYDPNPVDLPPPSTRVPKQAMQEEPQALDKAQNWDSVDTPSDQEVVGNKWGIGQHQERIDALRYGSGKGYIQDQDPF
ncbi:hypothetical protein PIB30_046964 [Stylosanthes scabra]|uniref:Uncharacterized protein n=1 Tax=Stylosanthes scabra TaxID=79078 RepID=A0ABU6SGK3_9FABA|nr:hypothetical protein [Stylosanthes scabra]